MLDSKEICLSLALVVGVETTWQSLFSFTMTDAFHAKSVSFLPVPLHFVRENATCIYIAPGFLDTKLLVPGLMIMYLFGSILPTVIP